MFKGPKDIPADQKNTGKEISIDDDKLMPQSVLDVPIFETIECGFLGILFRKIIQRQNICSSFYYTEFGNSVDESNVDSQVHPLGSRLYCYKTIDSRLINTVLLLYLFALLFMGRLKLNCIGVLNGPDNKVYLIAVEVERYKSGKKYS